MWCSPASLVGALGRPVRDRAGRLDVAAARIASTANLSDVEALINPMRIHSASE